MTPGIDYRQVIEQYGHKIVDTAKATQIDDPACIIVPLKQMRSADNLPPALIEYIGT